MPSSAPSKHRSSAGDDRPRGSDPATSPCTCFRVRKLTRLMSQRYDQALAPAQLNLNQYSILRRASAAPRSIGEFARELGMDRSTLSRDLKPLVAAGWVATAAGEDARQRRIQVTPAGKRAIARAIPLWQAAQDAIERELGRDGLLALHAQLDLAIAQLQGPRA
ncbi:DNA-binding transcriptional regulator, MarR family [Lysobacter sp. cf310]|nr:DNA-binding transcriptional regulator, MarR family [Lysobacter sp. cf310]